MIEPKTTALTRKRERGRMTIYPFETFSIEGRNWTEIIIEISDPLPERCPRCAADPATWDRLADGEFWPNSARGPVIEAYRCKSCKPLHCACCGSFVHRVHDAHAQTDPCDVDDIPF